MSLKMFWRDWTKRKPKMKSSVRKFCRREVLLGTCGTIWPVLPDFSRTPPCLSALALASTERATRDQFLSLWNSNLPAIRKGKWETMSSSFIASMCYEWVTHGVPCKSDRTGRKRHQRVHSCSRVTCLPSEDACCSGFCPWPFSVLVHIFLQVISFQPRISAIHHVSLPNPYTQSQLLLVIIYSLEIQTKSFYFLPLPLSQACPSYSHLWSTLL